MTTTRPTPEAAELLGPTYGAAAVGFGCWFAWSLNSLVLAFAVIWAALAVDCINGWAATLRHAVDQWVEAAAEADHNRQQPPPGGVPHHP